MKNGKLTPVQVALSENDRERLRLLCSVFEMNTSECLRYLVRTWYTALGERVDVPGPNQLKMFPTVMPDGHTPVAMPIPRPVERDGK